MKLPKYSIGTGDRFGCQGKAQLAAIIKAQEKGINIAIVWNKSYREHLITKTKPLDVLKEAQDAVRELNWEGNYYIDADHVDLSNVDSFIDSSNYFTFDIAKFIGKMASDRDIKTFIEKYKYLTREIFISNINKTLNIKIEQLNGVAENYLLAIKEARKIYNKVERKKGKGNFIVEISMDETIKPQTPIDILFILAAIADMNIPVQTIAPKFIGRFNKGVDYKGDINQFAEQFELILGIIQFAKQEFSLSDNLKLSIHSGSDKFSIYNTIKKLIKRFNTGIHLKTAGTTWLEELIGLAMSGNEGLEIVKEIYIKTYDRYDELCEPYSLVIDIDKIMLPNPKEVTKWSSEEYIRTLAHDKSCPDYNLCFRQLLHLGYKVAAEMGSRYKKALKKYNEIIAQNVTENLFERHIKKLFL
ncbi:MAG: hypothetical protein HWN81_02655 [Candidatus Lokiarchaeota archaeon]|nr:hypothetical protein [Candidatus Lokiarchaeota archaeon]